jgi:hypothetical protein
MIDFIKNLKPEDKFKAFVVVVLLSTITSIATVYLSTDDCSGLSEQYKTLVNNHTQILTINNTLIQENNRKQNDLILVGRLIDSLLLVEVKSRKVSSVRTEQTPIVMRSISPDDTLLRSAPAMMIRPPEVITVENTVIKNQLDDKQESILHKVKDVTSKYEE